MSSAPPSHTAITSERRFFLWVSLIVAATVFAGFGRGFAMGRESWAELPLQVRLHSLVFSGWLALYVAQNALVVRGAIAWHRRLGFVGAVLAAAMLPLGIVVTVMAMQRGGTPRYFPPSIFLTQNVIVMIAFTSLVGAGIALRARSDWHRRLVTCGAILLTGAAFARLLPMQLFGAFATPALIAAVLAYVAVGIIFDLRAHRRVHCAWWVGAGVVVAIQLAIVLVASTAPIHMLAARLSTPSEQAAKPSMPGQNSRK